MNNDEIKKQEQIERLRSLAGEGVTISQVGDISQLLNKTVFQAEVHISGSGTVISLPKDLGIDEKTLKEGGKKVYSESLTGGKLNLLKRDQIKMLQKLEARARNSVKNRLIGGFIPIGCYEQLVKEFSETREDYLKYVDEIYREWEDNISEYKRNLTELFENVNLPEERKATELKKILITIPNKDIWKSGFGMSLTVKAYPVVSGSEGLNSSICADIDRTFDNETLKTAILAAEELIGRGWSLIGTALKSHIGFEKTNGEWQDGKGIISSNSISAILNYGKILKMSNILQNPLLEEISTQIRDLLSYGKEEQVDILDGIFTKIYRYADEREVYLDMSFSPWTEKTLRTKMALYK